ncbi:MAG: cytochrome c peroxidase [Bacteroidota bacterium]
MKKGINITLIALFLALSSCVKEDLALEESTLNKELHDALIAQSNDEGLAYFILPESDDFENIPQDPNNPINQAKVELGKLLFHESAIGSLPFYESSAETYSCASCHHAAAGFQANVSQGIGEGGIGFGSHGEGRIPSPNYSIDDLDVQPIRSPSILNGCYQEVMLWNGQFGATGANIGTEGQWVPGSIEEHNNLGFEGLETQAIAGMKVHRMNLYSTFTDIYPEYANLFNEAYSYLPENQRINNITAGLAMAAFERTVLANESPFQKWLKGDFSAMSDSEKEGALLFFGKASCSNCHTGPALNKMEFHALGMKDLDEIPGTYDTNDNEEENLGRGGFTQNPEDNYKFKTPQLYNLKDSKFYGHGASFNSVEEVINYKNLGISENTSVPDEALSEDFHSLGLSAEEIKKISLFVENALYDPNLSRYEPSSLPSGFCFPNNDSESRQDLGCQ